MSYSRGNGGSLYVAVKTRPLRSRGPVCLSALTRFWGGYLAIIPASSFTIPCKLRLTIHSSAATLTPMVPGTGSRDRVPPKSGGQDPLTSDEVSCLSSGQPFICLKFQALYPHVSAVAYGTTHLPERENLWSFATTRGASSYSSGVRLSCFFSFRTAAGTSIDLCSNGLAAFGIALGGAKEQRTIPSSSGRTSRSK